MDWTPAEVCQTAYRRLKSLTPLRIDCGRLCNQACCQESDEELGMYLFPGEAELLSEQAEFLEIEPTAMQFLPAKPVWFASCHGHCRRELRPLACRIFPLTPFITAKGLLTTIIDPRARTVCPLARPEQRPELHPQFIRAVRDIGHLLNQHAEIHRYLVWLSSVLEEYREFPF